VLSQASGSPPAAHTAKNAASSGGDRWGGGGGGGGGILEIFFLKSYTKALLKPTSYLRIKLIPPCWVGMSKD
jgi:hypothetical protein